MNDLSPELRQHLSQALLCLADDELILGHRNSEWCGHAPILEEDIAFANLALDEIGHAALWYQEAARLLGEDPETYPDRLVYFRPAEAFQSLPLVEYPNGDWAFSMLRQYMFDLAERIRLHSLSQSSHAPIAQIAAVIAREEIYHLRHTHAWVKRLGLGTQESHRRMQTALEKLWPLVLEMFAPLPGETNLVEAGILPDSNALQDQWLARVTAGLTEASLVISALDSPREFNDWPARQKHTPYLKPLVFELQSVARLEPDGVW
jgi:ring-1,2-phenylacetyl-CoA epoxidase subunit PaaC